jgi:hypothetical protein
VGGALEGTSRKVPPDLPSRCGRSPTLGGVLLPRLWPGQLGPTVVRKLRESKEGEEREERLLLVHLRGRGMR